MTTWPEGQLSSFAWMAAESSPPLGERVAQTVVRLGIPPLDIIPGFQGKFLSGGIICVDCPSVTCNEASSTADKRPKATQADHALHQLGADIERPSRPCDSCWLVSWWPRYTVGAAGATCLAPQGRRVWKKCHFVRFCKAVNAASSPPRSALRFQGLRRPARVETLRAHPCAITLNLALEPSIDPELKFSALGEGASDSGPQ